jgi:L-ascorbate metabolism protein UlaG (beta-lactamase superfamily)
MSIPARLAMTVVLLAALAGCASGPSTTTTTTTTTASTATSAAPQPMPAGRTATAGKTEVLWLGQATTRITTPGGKVIVIDPWLTSNPKTPAAFKDLKALGKVDLILVTHAHFDHFADVPALAKMNNAPAWGPAGLNDSIVKLGILPVELSPRFGKGGTIAPFGATGPKITAVHAEHSSELTWKDASGKETLQIGGEPVGFILEMENGFRIWHMGDTAVFGDMRLIADMYHPDLVLAPIGGHFVMNPKDAAMAIRDMVKPRYVVPIHYGTTPQLRGTPAEFDAALGHAAGTPRMIALEPGQQLEF